MEAQGGKIPEVEWAVLEVVGFPSSEEPRCTKEHPGRMFPWAIRQRV